MCKITNNDTNSSLCFSLYCMHGTPASHFFRVGPVQRATPVMDCISVTNREKRKIFIFLKKKQKQCEKLLYCFSYCMISTYCNMTSTPTLACTKTNTPTLAATTSAPRNLSTQSNVTLGLNLLTKVLCLT